MVFNNRQSLESNTTTYWKSSIWRVFIEGKLFVSETGQTCFDTLTEATNAVNESRWMKTITSYVDYSQEFFGKVGDAEWRADFLKRVFSHVNIEYKEYTCNE